MSNLLTPRINSLAPLKSNNFHTVSIADTLISSVFHFFENHNSFYHIEIFFYFTLNIKVLFYLSIAGGSEFLLYYYVSQLHPLFAHLPVENMVFSNQQTYYEAITTSSAVGESTPFIEFMLGEILATLTRGEADNTREIIEYVPIKVDGIFPNNIPNIFPNNIRSKYPHITEVAWYIASLLNNTPGASADQVGKAIGISGRMVRNHIATLRNLGIIERIGSNKSGYWKVNRIE